MKNLVTAFLSILFITIGFFLVASSLERAFDTTEKNECRKWQEYSAQYTGFYLVQWQKDQCDAHEIIINSPVK